MAIWPLAIFIERAYEFEGIRHDLAVNIIIIGATTTLNV